MTMISFRLDEDAARRTQEWAERLGIDRSELMREALRRYLNQLATERDAEVWREIPSDGGERSLAAVADWGPAEDWSDWADEAG